MKEDYIPKSDGDLNTWETNFADKVGAITTTLGIPALDVNPVTDAITQHQTAYNNSFTADAAAVAAKSEKKKFKKQAIELLRALANRIKAAPGYTETMGNTLRIIGVDTDFDPATAKPHVKLSLEGNNVVIEFNNPREVDGVKIFSKRGNESAYTFLATDTESPYIDNRANLVAGVAEQRKYYAFFFDDDAEIGLQSDEVSISITK